MELQSELEKLRDPEWEPFMGCRAHHTKHDAAYAHALTTAIKEFRAAPLDTSLTFPSDAVDWLEWRAAELMHEWGFEQSTREESHVRT